MSWVASLQTPSPTQLNSTVADDRQCNWPSWSVQPISAKYVSWVELSCVGVAIDTSPTQLNSIELNSTSSWVELRRYKRFRRPYSISHRHIFAAWLQQGCIAWPMPSCGVCPSVRLSCCLSRSCIVPKRGNILRLVHHRVDTPLQSFHNKPYGNIKTGTPITAASTAGGLWNRKLSCRRGRALLCVIEYFAKSLRITQDHSKWHPVCKSLLVCLCNCVVSRTIPETFSVKL